MHYEYVLCCQLIAAQDAGLHVTVHRNEWNKKLDEIFRQYHLGEGRYKKNDKNIYFLVDSYQGVKTAIQNAKRRMAEFKPERCKPSAYDPGTMVYQLVEELKSYLDE